ncbi:8424_t:CDS:2 [Acaulospora morrowiae]|uniref:8424_t:CDS:1 n=1 Tax=Acaulospora morrowiae TaxID=94023 RepID=A0A9N9I4S8_9GLOM|nr:8424_t:CDS:2 [Acaulospora morrowiae]
MKYLMVILFTLAALSSMVFTMPAPELLRRDRQSITVTSPGAGPWKKGSLQAVSWWSTDIPSDSKVIIEITDKSGTSVFKDSKSVGTGTIGFTVGSGWDSSSVYKAKVYLESDSSVLGTSGDFTIAD